MRVKRWRAYGPSSWLLAVCLSPLAIWSTAFSYLHEIGHVAFGFGGVILGSHLAMVNVDWYGCRIAGSAFPMLLLCLIGRVARRRLPPIWALAGLGAWFLKGWEYRAFGVGADYPYHSIPHLWGILVIGLLCVYTLCKPSTKGVLWPHLEQSWLEAKDTVCRPKPGLRAPTSTRH